LGDEIHDLIVPGLDCSVMRSEELQEILVVRLAPCEGAGPALSRSPAHLCDVAPRPWL
jgi:hypothetical protein